MGEYNKRFGYIPDESDYIDSPIEVDKVGLLIEILKAAGIEMSGEYSMEGMTDSYYITFKHEGKEYSFENCDFSSYNDE